MPNLSNIARPYALAAFEWARDKKQLAEWKAFLEAASYMAQQSSVTRLLNNPEILWQQKVNFFQEVLASQLDQERKNFLLLLAQNKRLIALPEIADLFKMYYDYLEKISKVRVITAIDIDDAYRQKLSQALANRIKHEIELSSEVDPAIIGGAILHIGDNVIDGSILGKLNRLLEFSLR